MARSMLSFGMDSALALATARRRRAFIAGSGMPDFAATVISRDSFEKSLERTASALPFRCMMFLNFEWPAMGLQTAQSGKRSCVLTSDPPADQRQEVTLNRRC